MNTLSRLDTYLSAALRPSRSGIASAAAAAAALSSAHHPSSGPSSQPQSCASSSGSLAPSISLTKPTPAPSPTSTPPRALRLPPARRRRRRRPTGASIKLPPPTTPVLVRIALAFWSILLSFWRSLVGDTRAVRTLRHKRAVQASAEKREGALASIAGLPGLKGLSELTGLTSEAVSASSDEGSASEAEPSDREWVDPVTRAPDTGSGSGSGVDDAPSDSEFGAPRPRTPTAAVSFRLRSAQNKETVTLTTSIDVPDGAGSGGASGLPVVASPNPLSLQRTPPGILTSSPPRRSPRLLANPIATAVLDPSVPAVPHRSVTPSHVPPPRPHQTPFHLQKTLILDLDETLIHSTSRPIGSGHAGTGMLGLGSLGPFGGKRKRRGEGHTVEVVLNGRSTTYHVYKRPYVDFFLKKVASWYTLVIFTASMPEYADPVIDWLDNGRGLFAKRLYRESCHLQSNGSYIKDLADVEPDLGKVCFMDNSPISYSWNKGE